MTFPNDKAKVTKNRSRARGSRRVTAKGQHKGIVWETEQFSVLIGAVIK